MTSKIFTVNNMDELFEVAKSIQKLILEKKKIFLYGEMGSGKTTFTKAIARLFNSNDSVTSPTFSLVNEYNYMDDNRIKKIVHIDMYRIKNEAELFESGIEEHLFDDHITIIEWPQIVEGMIENVLTIKIEVIGNSKRKFVIL